MAGRDELRLAVDWTSCDGRGLCSELLPELIERDEWGFPIVADIEVPHALLDHVRRAVDVCPTLALRLRRVVPPAPQPATARVRGR